MHRVRIVLTAMMAVALVTFSTGDLTQAASGFANPAFQAQWQTGEAVTQNFWGPLETAQNGQQEPYKEASGGQRLVQYFDKGRMELTNGAVTNGLLATEIIKGQIQVGDSTFQPLAPPNIAIAGDASNPAPTYAGLASQGAALLQPTSSTPGKLVLATIGADGSVGTTDAAIPDPAVTIGGFDDATRHNVAQAFVDYRNKAGLSTIGFAISEPFRANVKVGGTAKDVMVQIFERRALTYTASNPDAFKVEMGNIGQHYFQWRYASGAAPAADTGTPPTVDVTGSVALQPPAGWTADTTPYNGPPPTPAVFNGPAPTLKFIAVIDDQTQSLGDEIAADIQSAHRLAGGGITTEQTTDRTIGGEAAKVYTFTGRRSSDKPSDAGGDRFAVSGLIAVVLHGGKVYTFYALADASALPNADDVKAFLDSAQFI
jgi:hypothetical protein